MPARASLSVVDVGSNSGRLVVVAVRQEGHLEILADARFPLRLVREVESGGRLGATAISRVSMALRGFLAVSRSARAGSLVAVATAAVREAANRDEFVERVAQQTGVEMEILDGDQEARYAFAGAVHGLPVDSGLVVDVGGGSVEICHFRGRRALHQWTLPLGALRLSDRFLLSDPPKPSEIGRLREHVVATIREAGVPPLGPGERLVGTGGTLRNLAKVDRASRTYPIARIHGYRLGRSEVDVITERLSARTLARRERLPGLSDDRADTIVGGALCAQALLLALEVDDLLVAGRGLREGIALERLGLRMHSAAEVRRASVHSLAGRFATWDRRRAKLRRSIATTLLQSLDPKVGAEMQEVLDHASVLVDIGRSIDFYSRWEHAARIVSASDLYGFDHRQIVLLSAVLEKAGEDRISLPGYRALIGTQDRDQLERLGVILNLADTLGHRLLPGAPLQVQLRRSAVTVLLADDIGQLEDEIDRRFLRCFGKRLRTEVTHD